MRGPWSLTSRLVASVVVLVALSSLLVTGATAYAMDRYLTDRLDQQVAASLARAVGPGQGGFSLPAAARADAPPPDGPRPDEGRRGRRDADPRDLGGNLLGQGQGTLLAILPGDGADPRGLVVPERSTATVPLDRETLRRLSRVRPDGRVTPVRIELEDGGPESLEGQSGGAEDEPTYRVLAAGASDGSVLLVGLPTAEVERTVATITASGVGLSALGVAAAGLGGLFVVRRQLRPLQQVAATAEHVAALPLGRGDIDLRARVPAQLADGRTEAGQVGAALNTLLGHVEASLEERHASEQRVRRFVADASHELRTPLTTIAGYAQLARRTPDDAAQLAAAMAKVEDQSGRMKALVEDLLLLARLDSGRPLAQDPVDLTRLLLESVADARVVSPGHAWRLDLPDEAVEVVGDELRLQQVLGNLLANAARHTPAGTTVTGAVSREAGVAVLEVRDDGPGVPAGLAATVFDRFTRGDSSRTRAAGDPGGAGLGLSLVRAIAEAHGGSVSVRSRPGATCFQVRLPLDGA